MDLRDAACEPMRRLGELSGETIHLGVYDEPHVVYTDKIESTFPVRMYSRIGARTESYCTGVAKALVDFLGDFEFERYLCNAYFERFTPRTITNAEGLREEVARIGVQRYALDSEEHVRCVTAPAFRRGETDIRTLAPMVTEAAREVSANLGTSRAGGEGLARPGAAPGGS